MSKLQSAIGLLAICITLFIFVVWSFSKTTSVALNDLLWEKPPSFVVVDGIQKDKQSGLLFIRLKDNKEQFIAGTWNVAFSESGAYAYGAFPKGYAKEDGQHIYYLSEDGRIYHIQMAEASLPINYIHESPDTNYLFIKSTRGQGQSFCVIPRINEDKPNCQQLDVGGVAEGQWNPNKPHELAISTVTGQIFTFDPWENKPHFVDQTNSNNQHRELTHLLSSKPSTLAQKPFTFHLLNLLIIKQNNSWHFVHVPLFSRISWLHDWTHLLIVNKNNLSVLEPFSKKIATLKNQLGIGDHAVFLRSNGFDTTTRP